MLLLNIVVLIAGFFALIKGADVFVDGSAALAKNFKIPSLIIGLTVVAMGTSAPELAVSVSAGLQGANEISGRVRRRQPRASRASRVKERLSRLSYRHVLCTGGGRWTRRAERRTDQERHV